MERLGRYIAAGSLSWFELIESLKRILAMIVWNVYCWSDLELEDGCWSSRRFPSFISVRPQLLLEVIVDDATPT